MIKVRSLRKAFGQIQAVDDLSLDINKGEAFGLLGPNGAGKTTTINMLIGLTVPDAGEVRIGDGLDPTLPATRRRVGIAPQALSLYGELTAQDNLRFFAKLYGLSGSQLASRVDWALQFAQLGERRRHRVETYSGGMKRRLNLACALIHDPDILLMDEPTVGVDPQSRNHLFECIERLKDSGKTILYTTHYMEEAQRLCDRIAIMDHGRLLAVDTVSGLINAYGGASIVRAELAEAAPSDCELPGSLDGKLLQFDSSSPLDDVVRLAQRGLTFSSLRITQPDLEKVFLTLTGRTLRDA